MYSLTVREVYRKFHDLDIGLYTIGPCESGPDNLAPGTSIGRYSSIYYTVRTIPAEAEHAPWGAVAGEGEHVPTQASSAVRLAIGNDVFIGHNAIILPTVQRIGDGAFIGAGAVVQKPVPPYGVVMGNPARVVKYRFSERTIADLLQSRWWEKSLAELAPEWKTFEVPLERDSVVRV